MGSKVYVIKLWPQADEETSGKIIYSYNFIQRIADKINKQEISIVAKNGTTIGHTIAGACILKGASIFLDAVIENGHDDTLNDRSYLFCPLINIDVDNPDDALDTNKDGVKTIKDNVSFTVKHIDLYHA